MSWIHLERLGPLNGTPPGPSFWGKLAKTQEQVEGIEKDAEMSAGKKGTHSYSRTEPWLRDCRKALHANGLIAIQTGGISKSHTMHSGADGVKLAATFAVIEADTGHGYYFCFDWLVALGGNDMHISAGNYTITWKYFLRGLLMVPQVDVEPEGMAPVDDRRATKNGPIASGPTIPARPSAAANTTARPATATRPAAAPEHRGSVATHPTVRASRTILDSRPADALLDAGEQEVQKTAHATDDNGEPGYEDLLKAGFSEPNARLLASLRGDQPLAGDAKEIFSAAFNKATGGDTSTKIKMLMEAGFTPSKDPNNKLLVSQMRRVAAALNLNKENE